MSTSYAPAHVSPEVLVLEMQYHSMKNYTYVVIDPATHRAVVLDPAWEIDKIHDALASRNAILDGILATHSHPDHVHLAQPLADEYGCPIWMSHEEIRVSGFAARQLVGIGNEFLRVGQLLIEPVSTPGHTPGCMCYLIGDNLFSGDVLFAEGCGICSDRESAHAMYSSLQYLRDSLQPHTRIFPGHSYGTPPGQTLENLLRDNIYLHFRTKESFAAFRLRDGQDYKKMFRFS